ncbi:MAG: DUF2064 domain-containing protein [Bacteroidota bacterium]
MQIYGETAILVFSRSVSEEISFKSLLSGKSKNFKLLSHLNKRMIKTVKASGLPVIHSTEENQHGSSFGEKLANAIGGIFSKGFKSIIIVGNDCADLSCGDLLNARDLLRTNDLILGPDFRGGTYLIGLNKESFNKNLFECLDWQSCGLQYSFKNYASGLKIRMQWLRQKADLNDATDLQEYWNLSHGLRALIHSIFSILRSLQDQIVWSSTSLYVAFIHRRGP